MKSNKVQRPGGGEEPSRKGTKLDPIRKSGKERHEMYKSLDSEDDDGEWEALHHQESVLDYLDDEPEEEWL
jgi:hypothetical protein